MADFSKTTTGFKPAYSNSVYKPYHQGNQFANGAANSGLHSNSYDPAWRNISCPPDRSPYMMHSPKNHDQYLRPRGATLTDTKFMDSFNKTTLDMKNYKGNSFKETVSPFFTKNRRALTKIAHKETRDGSPSPTRSLDDRNSKFDFSMEKFTQNQLGKKTLNTTLGSQESLKCPPPIFRNTINSFANNTDLRGSVERQTIVTEAQHSNQRFRDYGSFQKDMDPNSSKCHFQHFLQRKVSEKKHYDSNIGNQLTHHHKILAYKEKELNQRAAALAQFEQQSHVHSHLSKHTDLSKQANDMQKLRHVPDQYNIRCSPRKFTAITHYTKMMKDSRVFMPDGRMRVIRPNIHP